MVQEQTEVVGDFNDLKILGNYSDFSEFYSTNKDIIFKNTVLLYKELAKSRKTALEFNLHTKINNINFDSTIEYTVGNRDLLIRVLLPYFEENEDYEICSEIIKTHEILKKLWK